MPIFSYKWFKSAFFFARSLTPKKGKKKGNKVVKHIGIKKKYGGGVIYVLVNMEKSFIVSLPGGSVVKNPPANAGDVGLISEWERSFRGVNSNLLQYYCLDSPMDRGSWWATIHGVAKSWTWLSAHTHTHTHTYACWLLLKSQLKLQKAAT